MMYVVAGFLIVLWLAALILLAIKTMDERFDNKGYKWSVASGIFLTLTFALLMYGIAEEEKACQEVGGQMVKTGSQTTFIMSGNVMVPMTTDKKDCLKEISE